MKAEESPGQEERPGMGTEAFEVTGVATESNDTEVGSHTAALGFTRAEIESAKRRAERIARRRARRQSYLEWEAKRDETDVLAGLRAVWRVTVPEDRPALERLAERFKAGTS